MFKLTILDNDKWIAEGIAHYFEGKHIQISVPENILSHNITKLVADADVVISELTGYGQDVQFFLEALCEIRHKLPNTRLILLTDFEEAALIGYVKKNIPDIYIVSKKIEINALADAIFGHDDIFKLRLSRSSVDPKVNAFTPKEFNLLRPLASGQSLVKIALSLNVSGKTICNHRSNIMKKLSCKNTVDLTRLLTCMGFV